MTQKKSKTKIIGILNVTPDSFSDGGSYFSQGEAITHAIELLAEGADIVDIGAESTRPQIYSGAASAINPMEEWNRLKYIIPEVVKMTKGTDKKVSIDTRNPETAERALEAGVHMINDESALADKRMIHLIKKYNVDIIFMHNLGIPVDTNKIIDINVDPVEFIKAWAKAKIDYLTSEGINLDKIIFDPGISFGKNPAQSMEIIKRIKEFEDLNVPILVGHSRKSFITAINPELSARDRDIETFVITNHLIKMKVDYIRVHNVSGNVRSIIASEAFLESV